ncbi:MAG TPA: DUF6683 family protein [Burkholderiaceae bacterium]|nr:DUF6683 family protein [Burkholderiaceae bacterium]
MTKRSILRNPIHRPTMPSRATPALMRKTLVDALLHLSLSEGASQPSLKVERAAVATAPSRMAAAQTSDPAARAQIAASYSRYLDTYRAIAQASTEEQSLDDVGRAVAFFVAVNLHALHGVDADTHVLIPLERQLRRLTRDASKWDTASTPERQAFFEQIAIAAMLVSGTRASAASQGPQAVSGVRRAARTYLEQTLGLNPDLVTLGPTGMVPREHNTTARLAATAGQRA